jgi:cytochrome c-type biogenesis protein CcsB
MDLETLSFNLMNSATVVYAVAMVAFAYDFAYAAQKRQSHRQAVRADDRVAVAANATGAAGTTATVDTSKAAPAEDAPDSLRSKAAGIAVSLTFLAFVIHLAAVLIRAYSAGRAPWGNMYEFSCGAALTVVAVYLVLLPRYDLRWLGVFVITPVVLTLGLAVTVLYTPGTESLVPALNSYWLPIHVTAAVISAGIFTVATAATVLYLVVDRADRLVAAGDSAGAAGWIADRVPTAARLDLLAFRVIAFGFPIWTFAVVSGAIWAEDAWGRYWGWDPKETWAFIVWVVYACYLHARVTAGWKGRRAAIIAIVGFLCFMFNYFGVNIWIPGLHSYA